MSPDLSACKRLVEAIKNDVKYSPTMSIERAYQSYRQLIEQAQCEIEKSRMINISKLDKSEVLAALYNNAEPGMSVWRPPLSKREAAEFLKDTTYFDYLLGRVLKVELSGETFDAGLYDRDNGTGAAEAALKSLKEAVK